MADTAKYNDLLNKFKGIINLLSDESMKNHTSLKVGGPADLFARPESQNEFIDILKTASKLNIDVTITGNGTNLLISDKGIRGLVISTSKFTQKITKKEIGPKTFTLTAPSGTRLSSFCQYAMENNLHSLEWAAGIPGTIGGAVAMNAGTPKGSISEILTGIKTLNNSGDISEISRDNLEFSYRGLNNLNDQFILEVSLLLQSGDIDKIRLTHMQTLNMKKSTQPLSSRSAGCIFKNPASGDPAGKLIDMAGLKGKKVGDAMVSEKHANFILNSGNATYEDIINLKQLVEEKIFSLFSVKLETEIIIKGEQ